MKTTLLAVALMGLGLALAPAAAHAASAPNGTHWEGSRPQPSTVIRLTPSCSLGVWAGKSGSTLTGLAFVSCAGAQKTIEIQLYAQQCQLGIVGGLCILPGQLLAMTNGHCLESVQVYQLWCPGTGSATRSGIPGGQGWRVSAATTVIGYDGSGLFEQDYTSPIQF